MSAADAIRVLLSKEGEHWVAQSLEYDIGAQARDLDQLSKRLLVTIQAERDKSLRRHGKPFAGIGPAPQSYHDLWLRRAGEFKPVHLAVVTGAPDIAIEFGLAAYRVLAAFPFGGHPTFGDHLRWARSAGCSRRRVRRTR